MVYAPGVKEDDMRKPQLPKWVELELCWRLRMEEVAREQADRHWKEVLDDLEAEAWRVYGAAVVDDIETSAYLLTDRPYVDDEFTEKPDAPDSVDELFAEDVPVSQLDLVAEVVQVA